MSVYKIAIKGIKQQGSIGRQLEFRLSSQTAGFSKKVNRGAKNIRLASDRPITDSLTVDLAVDILERDKKYPDTAQQTISVDLDPKDTTKEVTLTVPVTENLGPKSKRKNPREAVFTLTFLFTLKETDQEGRKKRADKFAPDLNKALDALLPTVGDDRKLDRDAIYQLLLGTANHESGGFVSLDQQSGGPAKGVVQMEPATYNDLWKRYLGKSSQAKLAEALRNLAGPETGTPGVKLLKTNNACAAGMALVRYLDHGAGSATKPLPPAGDVDAQAEYWGKLYQTKSSPAKIKKYIKDWKNTFGP